jgi:hypothetical protein
VLEWRITSFLKQLLSSKWLPGNITLTEMKFQITVLRAAALVIFALAIALLLAKNLRKRTGTNCGLETLFNPQVIMMRRV